MNIWPKMLEKGMSKMSNLFYFVSWSLVQFMYQSVHTLCRLLSIVLLAEIFTSELDFREKLYYLRMILFNSSSDAVSDSIFMYS